MKRIAILSDTHGLLREEVKVRLAGADVIIHAGDIGNQVIVDTLCSSGEAYLVRGNNDREWAKHLPESLAFSVEGVRFFLIHDRKDLPGTLSDVDVVIFGHSHKYGMEEKAGICYLNPGSCGRRRFRQELSFCMMEVNRGKYKIERIMIPPETV